MGQHLLPFCLLFATLMYLSLESPPNCDEVRKVFHQKLIGPLKSVPDKPRTGSDLQVCASRNVTCCTKKMEERYQVAARRDIQNLLQISSSSLKYLISRNVALFQDTFENVMVQAENYTVSSLLHTYRDVAVEASEAVQELFTDVSLFVLGSETSVDELVQRFFDALFPLVYDRLINPGLAPISPAYAECARSARRSLTSPFGTAPAQLAAQVSRAAVPTRVFLQALHLGVEVINTTDHLQLSRECKRGLLKMNYCPHCQGLTRSRPCMGYCLNVLRGCLASLAEVDAHWLEFVRSLEELSGRMSGPQDLEQVLLGAHGLVQEAVAHAQKNGPRLSAQVHRICGHPSRLEAPAGSSGQLGGGSGRDSSLPLRAAPPRDIDTSLANRKKEFINSLRLYRTFYGGLADQLCMSELASGDSLACWNGADVVKSYTLRVVGNGIKAQSVNPEVKVKGSDPVINQIIDKLKHINQLLQGKSIPKFGSLDEIETGSGDREGRYSGDCDDEDGCWGSGNGDGKRTVQRVSKLTPEKTNSNRHHHHTKTVFGVGASAGSRAVTLGVCQALIWTCALRLLLSW
ncbi:glypican-5a [Engraulis encrasicolus]|uniref:glypican-5a n=1 Tax=Engraulis encrasicolus TaxID=184585 RepID=UPI002FCFD8CD